MEIVASCFFPLFSPASSYQCSESTAMLRFSMFDHDVLSFNDFAGEAYFSLNSIPGIQGANSTIGNFHGLKQVHLPLMFQENKGDTFRNEYRHLENSGKYHRYFCFLVHPIWSTLECRKDDKVAQDFLKKQKIRIVAS